MPSQQPIAVPQFEDDDSSSDDDCVASEPHEPKKDSDNNELLNEPPATDLHGAFQWGDMDEIQQLTHANAQLTDQVSDLKTQVKR